MANLTLSLDEKLLQAARLRAAKEGTSVNEVCRRAIEKYAQAEAGGRLQRFDALIARIDAAPLDALPSPWSRRDEMYDELFSRGRRG